MTPELYFLRYSFPCASTRLQLKKITQEMYDKVEDCAMNGKQLERKVLEETFPEAIERLRRLAKEMHKEYWSIEVIRQYFLKGGHNDVINRGEGVYATYPETMKEFCRVHIGKVIDKKEQVLKVEYNGKERIVFRTFVPDAKVGDRVTIHYGFAVEKV